jgi:ribulose-5-phosphate 4-epimerase/fuculose-1-phosphate aldolase
MSAAAVHSLLRTPAAQKALLNLTAGLRLLQHGGQHDLAAGFFSTRHPDEPSLFLAAPHGLFWREIVPSSFGVYSSETRERVDQPGGPMPNFPSLVNSAAIYSAHADVNALVHAHPASVMALCALEGDRGTVLPISESSFMFYERVAHLSCNFFFDPPYVQGLVDALGGEGNGGRFCALMRNHSYIMCGSSIPECYMRCYMLEQSAKVQLQVLAAAGGQCPQLPPHEECLAHRRSYEGYDGCPPYDGELEWPALLRQLDAEAPGWRGAHSGTMVERAG